MLFILALSICGCFKPNSQSYRALYAHLENPPLAPIAKWTSDYYLVIYVNARHLDYTDNYSFLNTIIRHPSDGSRNRDIGHVWIYLQGILDGELAYLYGGHSGELGFSQAKYFDGIMNYIDFGYANPSKEQAQSPRYESNPVKYLWASQNDGYFEFGSGGHCPTYAAKIDLTCQQFEAMLEFAKTYDFSSYALIGKQCCSFAAGLAALGGLNLECEIAIALNKELYLKGERIRFWDDPIYSQLVLASPDMVERSLMKAVSEGNAEYVDCGSTWKKAAGRCLPWP